MTGISEGEVGLPDIDPLIFKVNHRLGDGRRVHRLELDPERDAQLRGLIDCALMLAYGDASDPYRETLRRNIIGMADLLAGRGATVKVEYIGGVCAACARDVVEFIITRQQEREEAARRAARDETAP